MKISFFNESFAVLAGYFRKNLRDLIQKSNNKLLVCRETNFLQEKFNIHSFFVSQFDFFQINSQSQ